MFVNKIGCVSNLGFKGYQHVKNDIGETVIRFNFPYDSTKETCEIQFFSAVSDTDYNYKLSDRPIASVMLKPEGVNVNLSDITNLDREDAFAYKIVRKDKNTGKVIWEGADTGVKIKPADGKRGEYVFRVHNDKKGDKGYETSEYQDPVSSYTHTLVTRKGTTPLVHGAGYLVMPDSFAPGMMYRGFTEENTGDIYYDRDYQKKTEKIIKTFSNMYNGSMAGVQANIPYLKDNGYKILFSTPVANGDNVSSHSYWNKNNMQIAPKMGTTENFSSFMQDLFKNGIKFVNDGTFTSEGLEGIHFQYALRWAEKKPQSYYWFRMSELKNTNIGLGVVPKNKENLRHRVVNSPYNYELQPNGTYKKSVNQNYNPQKETLVQIYDASQVSKNSVSELDKAIKVYDNLTSGNELDIKNHDDTLINFVFQINPKEYEERITVINDLNKKHGKNIRLDTPDGTVTACEFSNFKFINKTEGGVVTWDANTDMVKMNYHISGYDEKILQAIPDKSMRDYEKQMIERGTLEVRDMTLQSGKYWTEKVKNIQTMYAAKTIGKAKTDTALEKLISDGKLPEEARLSSNVINNILNGEYLLAPKGIEDKDDVTVKSLMKLPLDSLEFGENTAGVLSTSYFSNRATTENTVGISRFNLMKSGNPHLVEPYSEVYCKTNNIFNNQLKNFTDEIIKKINENSPEKLLDANGNYTEYGEYVMELTGQDIAKYAFLKSLGGENFKTKILRNGEITYDYASIQEGTTLKALGIDAHSPEEEAELLLKKIEKGMKKLSGSDISFVADSISERISGTDTTSFRLAEAVVNRAGLGLDWRLDAAKDVMDMDAIRNEDDAFDDGFDNVIKFWTKFVQTVKAENPNSYIVAEITDIPDLMRDTYGQDSCPYNGETNIGQKFNGEPDAMTKLFNETGITSEAGYSYFFTNLLTSFSEAFDTGSGASEHHNGFKNSLDILLQTRSADYIRNLWTFMGNHDKPRMFHGLALDMSMFHYSGDEAKKRTHRLEALKILSGSKSIEDMPIELRLKIDNSDYMRTISTRAASMSSLLTDVVTNDIKGIASEEDIRNINNALIDLTNGNYLGEGSNINYQTINIPEISSLEKAFETILKMAETHGLKLSETEKKELINTVAEKAKSKDMTPYLVHGNFDWKEIDNRYRELNLKAGQDLLGQMSNYEKYDLYTVQLGRLLRDAYLESKKQPAAGNAIIAGLKDFVMKYDRETVRNETSELPKFEDTKTSMRKNAYAARDIKTAITMAVKQAEFKTGKPIQNREEIINTVFKYATEPAAAKAAMITEFLKGLPGISSIYAGDELGLTGYEEKAKNIYLQDRNALPWSDIDEKSLIGNYRKTVMNAINSGIKDRSAEELHTMNDGTPYSLDVKINNRTSDNIKQRMAEIDEEIKTNPRNKAALDKELRQLSKDLAKTAYMMQSANGDMTISLFNAGGIDHSNRFDYFAQYGLDTEEKRKKFFEENNIESINPKNPYVPIQPKSELDCILLGAGIAIPVGTVFTNANARDKAKYIVKEAGDKLGIFKEGGGKIVLDGKTSKNGVMILKFIKNTVFKGKRTYYNPQYNFASNPYSETKTAETGGRLSVVAK